MPIISGSLRLRRVIRARVSLAILSSSASTLSVPDTIKVLQSGVAGNAVGTVEPVLQNQLGGNAVDRFLLEIGAATGIQMDALGFGGGEAFVTEVTGPLVAILNPVGELARTAGHLGDGAIHVERNADHQCIGLPFGDGGVQLWPVRHAVAGPYRVDRGGSGGQALADGQPYASGAEVKPQHPLGVAAHVIRSVRRVRHGPATGSD